MIPIQCLPRYAHKGKGKGSFYIAQYPVRRTAQSAVHLLPSLGGDLFIPTPTRLLGKHSTHTHTHTHTHTGRQAGRHARTHAHTQHASDTHTHTLTHTHTHIHTHTNTRTHERTHAHTHTHTHTHTVELT